MPEINDTAIDRLRQLWLHSQNPGVPAPGYDANASFKVLYQLNLGMQETLQYLYSQQPSFDAFIAWIADLRQAHVHPADGAAHSDADDGDVLDADDLRFWDEHGYLVLKQAVNAEQCENARAAIWTCLGASAADPQSWYLPHPAKNGLMVTLTQHPALQAIRESALIRKAYEQLYKTKAIYKTIDKVSFNPPETAHYSFLGSALHWDASLVLPIPDKFQGLLYLTDVQDDGGAFQCVPGFHRHIDAWMAGLPKDIDVRSHATQQLRPTSIAGDAGDFIIWHQALPHCASPNRSRAPRLVQYLTYLPDVIDESDVWI